VLILITVPFAIAALSILAAIVIPNFTRARDQARARAEQVQQQIRAAQTRMALSQLVITPEQYTVAHPEPGELDWGFKCFVPPDHLARLVFVVWTNGVPTVDPSFSAYYKVGKAGGVDVPFCSLSCNRIPASMFSGITDAQLREVLAGWRYPESAGLHDAVQWNVNLGLGFTLSSWLPMPAYHRGEAKLPLKVRSGHQTVFGLLDFVQPEGEGKRGRSGAELRIFLEPLRSPPIRSLPDEIDRTNYIAGKGLAGTMEKTLKAIRERPTDP